MTLGAGALARPLVIVDPAHLHAPWLAMLAALCLVVLLAAPKTRLGRVSGIVLLTVYPLFVIAAVLL